MTLYPLVFDPILKEKVWGGRRLAAFGKAIGDDPDRMIGESWELADLPDSIPGGRSVIANGPWAGRTLGEVIADHRDAIMGEASLSEEGEFPLLIKFLDAVDNLSVQVHPDEAYVARHPNTHLKSEAWIVMHADPGAVIYKGLKPGTTADDFAAHIASGSVVNDLQVIEASVGDCHYLPSGTVHALGAGTVVAEVQTPSDTTFRVYDWDRTDRTLHIDEALECIHFGPAEGSPPGPERVEGALMRQRLIGTPYFEIERLRSSTAVTVPITPNDRPEIWMVLAGSALARNPYAPDVDLIRGSTVLFPARLAGASADLETGTSLLRITLPSR